MAMRRFFAFIWGVILSGILVPAQLSLWSAQVTFQYDDQNTGSTAYDGANKLVSDYDSAAVLLLKECWSGPCRSHAHFASFAEFLAADTGANIALGSRYSGLRTFASDIGADHLLDVPNNEWKDVFLSHVDNPSTTFHVNMGGFFGDTPSEMILNEMQSGSHTGWELQQLQQAGRIPQVNFYQPGNLTPIPNPFIK
jgi:hypothetical protein